MKKFLSWALTLTVIMATACDDDDDNSATLQQADRDFISKVSEANFAEIELGKLASLKSSTALVRDFGEMMMSEHQTALNEMESLAGSKNATMMTQLNSEHQQLKEKLMGMIGHAFDTAYIHSQVKDHAKVIELFQTEISSGQDEAVKAYAKKYLPHMQMHHKEANSISMTLDQ